MLRSVVVSSTFAALLLVGCDQGPAPVVGDAQNVTESGLLGAVPSIAFGTAVTGTITKGQLDVWAIDLAAGDDLSVRKTVLSGSLAPEFTLFQGPSTKIASTDHDASARELVKHYRVNVSGRYYLRVAAYQGQGAGEYRLAATCNAGPCAGDPVEPIVGALDEDQAGDCIRRARENVFARLPAGSANAFADAAAAKQQFYRELEVLTVGDDLSCRPACDEQSLCTSIEGMIAFYLGKERACLAELDACLSYCSDDTGENSLLEEQMCLVDGYNGTCDGYARGHADCGGAYADETNEQCHAFCESTNGVWMDDLDTICEDDCD